MRLLLLALVVLASSAAAQTGASSLPARALVGTAAVVAVPLLLYSAKEGAGYAGVVAAPLVATLAVHYLGTDGSGHVSRTFGGALLGALPGAVLYSVQVARGSEADLGLVPSPEMVVLYVAGSAVGAALMYRSGTQIGPAAFATPAGERAAGLMIRVSL